MKSNPIKYEKPNISGLVLSKADTFGNVDTVTPDPEDPIETEEPVGNSEEYGGFD